MLAIMKPQANYESCIGYLNSTDKLLMSDFIDKEHKLLPVLPVNYW